MCNKINLDLNHIVRVMPACFLEVQVLICVCVLKVEQQVHYPLTIKAHISVCVVVLA